MDTIEAEAIGHAFADVIERSDFYARKLQEFRGCDPVAEYADIPFTTKAEVLADQAALPPYGKNLAVPSRRIQRIHKTSGTTNLPVIIAMTATDVANTVAMGARCFRVAGLQETDAVIHCLNYNMWAGGYTDHQSLETAGAAVVPFGVGHTSKLVETMLLLRPTAIHCTPSYMQKLEVVVREEFHLQPQDLRLRLGLFGGESGLQNEDFRRAIESTWGFKAMNANYGMSEVTSMFGAECSCQSGLHFLGSKLLYPELIDPGTLKSVEFAAGSAGELVLTTLRKEAQPLLRYRTGDVLRVVERRCECVRDGFQFEIVGRVDSMLVIRGLNVFPSNIEAVINRHLAHITGTYQIHVNRSDPIDHICIKVELRAGAAIAAQDLRRSLVDGFVERIEITPDVEVLAEGALPRSEGKSARIFRSL